MAKKKKIISKSKKKTVTEVTEPKTQEKTSKRRINSGIKNLDPLIQGGLKDGSISLVTGGAGSGKTIFAVQFLMEGLKKGESCLYITFEEKRDKMYNDMGVFGWDFKSYEDKRNSFIWNIIQNKLSL